MASWIEVLPAVGAFLGGPAGGLVGSGIEWLAGKFGASEKTVDSIKQTLSGMTAEQLLKAKELDIEFQKFCLENDIKLQLAQIEVNTNEAKSLSLFVAGWRPAIGWIGASALAYSAILEPLLRFVTQVGFQYTGTYPAIDTNLTMQILMGILGLGAMRSFDKKQGTAT